jgi:hypothetical protein
MSDCVAAFVLASVAACWTVASLAGELRDRKITPGSVNAAISEQQYRSQCHAQGWTRPYRPAVSFTI